ncbi:hypothetical protein J4458_07100 [Candidatus Woesearchaeota archaeon]|nr:hypothetical protein [Candidatus Woesearchaeota archaeon]
MKIDDLAVLLGKTRREIEEMLKKDDVIELRLTEKNKSNERESGEIKIID